MPYNGVGQFTSLGAPTYPAVPGSFILASYFNATMQDVFDGLSTALPRDGQAAMAANLSMGNFRITGMANGVGAQDAVTYGQIFNGASLANLTLTGNVAGAGAATVTVPTVAVSDNSTNAASTAFVQAIAFSAALPSQAGHNGEFVTTDGSVASWASPFPDTIGTAPGDMLTVTSTGARAWAASPPQFLLNSLGVI